MGPIGHLGPIKRLPLNCSFFRSINLRKLRRVAKKITFDVIEQESLSVRISQIQTVVIDDLSLLLQPSTPTWLANLAKDSLPQFVWKRRACKSRPLFTAVRTFDRVSHVFLLGRLYGRAGDGASGQGSRSSRQEHESFS